MGFLLASNALLVLFVMLLILRKVYGDDWEGLYEVRSVTASLAQPLLPPCRGRLLPCTVPRPCGAVADAAPMLCCLVCCFSPRNASLLSRPPCCRPTVLPPCRPSLATVWAAPPSRCLAAWAAASTQRWARCVALRHDATVRHRGGGALRLGPLTPCQPGPHLRPKAPAPPTPNPHPPSSSRPLSACLRRPTHSLDSSAASGLHPPPPPPPCVCPRVRPCRPPTWAPTWWARWRRTSPRMTPATRP